MIRTIPCTIYKIIQNHEIQEMLEFIMEKNVFIEVQTVIESK